MRRLARHLFTLCSAASLLLCVATAALWVRSFSIGEKQSFGGQRWVWAIHSCRGRLLVQLIDNHDRMPSSLPAENSGRTRWIPLDPLSVEPVEGDVFSFGLGGFGTWYGKPGAGGVGWGYRNAALLVPYWFVMLLEGLLAIRLVKHGVPRTGTRGVRGTSPVRARRYAGICRDKR